MDTALDWTATAEEADALRPVRNRPAMTHYEIAMGANWLIVSRKDAGGIYRSSLAVRAPWHRDADVDGWLDTRILPASSSTLRGVVFNSRCLALHGLRVSELLEHVTAGAVTTAYPVQARERLELVLAVETAGEARDVAAALANDWAGTTAQLIETAKVVAA